MLGLWTAAVTWFTRPLPAEMVARVLGVMGAISTGFLLFMLLTSNPFLRLVPAPADGSDLNPLLQDLAMVLHPPLLYMGYVGFSVAFAFAISALLGGRLDAAWARWSRPWTTLAWMFLTCGIALGSFWAYYELGWGGWWFWDPVENASFMPWLVGTALIHSLAVTDKRGSFRSWTVLLAIATFSLSLLGAFLVRSGVLTSVHAFATDPKRGVFLLCFLAIVIGGSLLLYASRAGKRRARRQIRPDLARVVAAVQQRPARGGRRLGAARHVVSAVHRCAGEREALGGAAVLQHRLRRGHDAGDVPDGRGSDRALEEGEPAGAGGSAAMGVRRERSRVPSSFLSLSAQWKPLVSLGLLLALWIVTTTGVSLWETMKTAGGWRRHAVDGAVAAAQLLRHAAGSRRRGRVHRRYHHRHRLSGREGSADGCRRRGERRWLRFQVQGREGGKRTELPRRAGGHRGLERGPDAADAASGEARLQRVAATP